MVGPFFDTNMAPIPWTIYVIITQPYVLIDKSREFKGQVTIFKYKHKMFSMYLSGELMLT